MSAFSVCANCFFFLLFFFISDNAISCPDGYQPAGTSAYGNPDGCVPYPDSTQNKAQAPQGRWETRWGAIATDGSSTAVGTVIGVQSKQAAVKAAITQCRAKGGKACKSILSYYNQCAVIVTGDKQHLAQSAATVKEASDIGMNKCSALDTNCSVYYAECSPPEWIQ